MAIKFCPNGCEHPYQDAKYGPHMRVVTERFGGKGYKCTVCGKDIAGGGDGKKAKNKS